jgi:hypothetical protein
LRRIAHLALAFAGWFVFSWWWWLVIGRVSRDEVRYTVLFVGLTLVVCVGLTGLWAFHNLRLFRRRGPRTHVRTTSESYTHDRRGREIEFEAPLERLRLEPQVWITIDEDRKRYDSTVPEPVRDAAAARSWALIRGGAKTPAVPRTRGADVGR